MPTYVPVSQWSTQVKASFNNRCQYCGSVLKVQAHHIKPKSVHPELINDLENGIALCSVCHIKAHGGSFAPCSASLKYKQADCKPVQDFVERNLIIVIPKGLKQAVEAHAKSKGESINGLVNALLRADMGLSEAEWKAISPDAPSKEE